MNSTAKKVWIFTRNALILFAIGGLVFTILEWPFSDGVKQVFAVMFYNGLLVSLLWIGNAYLATSIKVSWIEQPRKRFFIGLVVTIIYTVIAASLAQIIFYFVWYGISPISSLSRISSFQYYNVIAITLLISTFLHGKEFLDQWKASVLEAERLKQAHLNARFESLKSQVNPHFLFNSFNVLSNLVYKDQDLAARFIKQLSVNYRYVLETKDKEVVPLSRELEALEAYIFLSKMRFGENLEIKIDLDPTEEIVLAPLTLQMLVENAIKHNVISKNRPLTIQIRNTEDAYIEVSNNLQLKNNRPVSSGIGLPNIRERYQYISDREVLIEESQAYFLVKIPLIKLQS